ncbi:MAG: ABC transporter substrate-binding protein [Candidatus Hodarchaeota archaeon]
MASTLVLVCVFALFVTAAAVPGPVQKAAGNGRFDITLHYTPSHYGTTEIDVAQLLEAQLEETGYFDVKVRSAEWSTYLDQLGTMEFFLLGWWFDYPDPSNYIDPFVGGGAFSMGTNYSSTVMDGYIDSLLTDPDAAVRTTATINAQKLMAQDVPCVPLFTMLSQFSAYETGVTGVVQEPSENMHYNTIDDADHQVVIGTTDSIRNIDPADCYEYYGSNTLVQLTHGLMEMPVDSTDAEKGPIVKWYNVSADATQYFFNLKQGVKFSDGQDLNATIVAKFLNRSSTLGGDPGFLVGDLLNETGDPMDNGNIVAHNETLLELNLASADATFLQRLTYTVAWPVSWATLDPNEIVGKPGDTWIAGTGPYKITTWTAGTEIILEPNPHYNATLLGTTAPANTKVTIKFYADASSLQLALESGEIDVAHKDFGADERTALKSASGITTTTKETAGIRYLLFNVESITDVRVRKAISAAVDRDELTSTIFQDYNEPLLSMVPEIFTSHYSAFPDGPFPEWVEGNMTAAGYESAPLEEDSPGFELFSTVAALFAAGAIFLTLGRKRKRNS